MIRYTYDDFIENEKKFASDFAKQIKIENLFDVCDYTHLKLFFNNENTVEKIYKNIREILDIKHISFEHLVFADFITSFFTYGVRNTNNLIFRIEREEYIHKIVLRAHINTVFDIDVDTYIEYHKRLLIALRNDGVIARHIIKQNIYSIWESSVFLDLNIEKPFLDFFCINMSKSEFKLLKIGGKMYTFSTFRNMHRSKRVRMDMEENDIPYDGIIASNKIEFKISSKLFLLCKSNINNEYNNILNLPKNNILKEINNSENELKLLINELHKTNDVTVMDKIKNKTLIINKKKEDLNKIMTFVTFSNYKEYFIKFYKLTRKNEYIKEELLMYLKSKEDETLIDYKTDERNEYEYLMHVFTKMLSMYILYEHNIFDVPFYLPSFMDNRGRQYYGTLISPTFSRIFRNLYEFNKNKKVVDMTNSIYYNKIIKYKNIVELYTKNDLDAYIYINLFIEIGKHAIDTTENYMIEITDIVKIGIDLYEKKYNSFDFDDLLYINKIFNLIDEIKNNKKFDWNTIIYKDATASGLQNKGIILGYKKETLQYLNLNGDKWCDTYQYLISKYVPKNNINIRFLKRKYWKSTIMTIPYNSVWMSCFKKFIQKINEDGLVINENDYKYLKTLHKNFYNKIKIELDKEFYYENKNKKHMYVNYTNAVKIGEYEYKINYQNKRDKYKNIIYLLEDNKEKTKRAKEANVMHHLDGKLIREVLKDLEIIPIHDCFGVRLSELHLLMDKINNYYAEYVGIEGNYSLFVLI